MLLVAIAALCIALDRNSTILNLVGNAWAGFGASFGPLIIISLLWKRMNRYGAMAGMVAITVLVWIYAPFTLYGMKPGELIYEIIPGFLFSTISIVVMSLITAPPSESIKAQFKASQNALKY